MVLKSYTTSADENGGKESVGGVPNCWAIGLCAVSGNLVAIRLMAGFETR
jgi:hypothetical protein